MTEEREKVENKLIVRLYNIVLISATILILILISIIAIAWSYLK